MTQAHHIVRVERPIEEVFDFLADGTNNPRWQRFVLRTAPTNEAVGVGHTFSQRVRHPLGFTVSADFRITEYERPQRLSAIITAGGPIRPTITYELTPDGEKATVLRCTVEHRFAGMARLAAPATALLHPLFAWEARSVERIGRCLGSATQEVA
jgi:uncharacterized protein YndB with AHSA1/START domain